MGMEVDLARTMLAVADRLSFSGAGEELAVVQSTVTTRIRALERHVGARLFDRSPQQVRLTEDGERLLPHARALVDAEDQLLGATRSADDLTGRVRVAAAESMCAYRLPQVIVGLMREHPGLEVEFFPAETRPALRHLLGRRCELAVLLDATDPGQRVRMVDVGVEPVLLVGAAGGPGVTRLEDLVDHPLFLFEEGCSYSDAFLGLLAARGVGPARVTRFSSIEAVKACVAAGLGIGLLPRASLRPGEPLEQLPVQVDPTRVVLAQERARYATPAVGAVAGALRSAWGGKR